MKLMFAWIGQADLDAAAGTATSGAGPIATAVLERDFDQAVLLATYPEERIDAYIEWLGERTAGKTHIQRIQVSLPSPVDYEAITRSAVSAVDRAREEIGRYVDLTFHLSPGTPAMAAVWLLLAKARYNAHLIDSSRAHGVRDVDVPFEIAADFVPEILRRSDRRLQDLTAAGAPPCPAFDAIVGRSDVMRAVLERARRVAPRSVPVLIEGESGTGKELLARAIHAASPRSGNALVAVNCGAIPDTLVESTLFGYVKGAFSGADRTTAGLFHEADGATIFLDEVGELPLPAQVKLLRAVQEGEVYRVGARTPDRVDVRVIAATNRVLIEEVAAGRFRSDLFYRLAVAVLVLPPLRRREGDLGLLIDHVLASVNTDQQAADSAWGNKELSAGARSLLLRHTWPGNVRELVNTLTRAAIWAASNTIDEGDMREAFHEGAPPARDEILDRPLGPGLDLRGLLAAVARHYLERAMAEAAGNKTRAAELVGLPSYQTLTNWLERYGVPG